MRSLAFIFALFFCCATGKGQSTAGITGTRDTSYNISNEYNKQLKNFPGIRVAGETANASVAEEKNIVYCKTKERELKLDVFYPKENNGEKRIAIIFIHGGGWRSGNKAMHYPLLQQLAARGFVCITPEYRLSTEALYPAAIYDIKTAIRWTRKNTGKYNIDVNKIVVSGHSSGGELAAFMGATNMMNEFEGNGGYKKYSSAVNAVIDMDGILAFIHPESGEGDDSKRTSSATYWFGYSKTENPDLWKQGSPLTYVGKHMPPIQFINSGVDRMHAGRDDFINILKQYNIYSEVKTFGGSPHTFILFNPWFDSTVQYMHQFINKIFYPEKKITVAQDGSGDFRTIQEAIFAVRDLSQQKVTIFIKNGVYKEKLIIPSWKTNIVLVGEKRDSTIITYDDYAGKRLAVRDEFLKTDSIRTFTSYTVLVEGNDCSIENITIKNTAGRVGQAVALHVEGDRFVAKNCTLLGNQDTLYTATENSRQYYQECHIEGTTDFIFGEATAVFQSCTIKSLVNSYITAASTRPTQKFGFVFFDCKLIADTAAKKVYLGRPWRPYSKTVYIRTEMGKHILKEGWDNWRNPENEKTALYAEYKSYGEGANVTDRVKWSKQLTAKEMKKYTLSNIFNGWMPDENN